jgi:hypothetical protein
VDAGVWDELKKIPRGDRVLSPTFEFAGKTWYLDLFPNGIKSKLKGFLSTYITQPSEVEFNGDLSFTFSIEDAEMNVISRTTSEELGCTPYIRGFDQFLRHDELERVLVNNGQFTLKVKIKDKNYETTSSCQKLQKLYENSENGNAQIECNDGVVKADKAILAQDPFFATDFELKENQPVARRPTRKRKNSIVRVDDCIVDLKDFSSVAVNVLIKYLYVGFLPTYLSIELRVELYFLTDFVTNRALCKILEQEIVNLYLRPSKIMDLLINLQGRPVPDHLPISDSIFSPKP